MILRLFGKKQKQIENKKNEKNKRLKMHFNIIVVILLMGADYITATSSVDWILKGGDIDGEATYDYSGYSVSLSADGSTVAIGAFWNRDNGVFSGHVRVYALVSPTTSPTKNPTTSPTKNPTTSPTKNPTTSPTTSPTKIPTTSPTTSHRGNTRTPYH